MKALCSKGHEMRPQRSEVNRKGFTTAARWVCYECQVGVRVTAGPEQRRVQVIRLTQGLLPVETDR